MTIDKETIENVQAVAFAFGIIATIYIVLTAFKRGFMTFVKKDPEPIKEPVYFEIHNEITEPLKTPIK